MTRSVRFLIGFSLTVLFFWMVAKMRGKTFYTQGADIVDAVAMATLRGLRNNNAGNIRISGNAWRGKIPLEQNTDGVFEQFVKPEDGLRALAVLVKTYGKKYGDNTIARIIARYAPSNENDTAAYIASVAKYSGIDSRASIAFTDPDQLSALVAAIVKHENGVQPYAPEVITRAVRQA